MCVPLDNLTWLDFEAVLFFDLHVILYLLLNNDVYLTGDHWIHLTANGSPLKGSPFLAHAFDPSKVTVKDLLTIGIIGEEQNFTGESNVFSNCSVTFSYIFYETSLKYNLNAPTLQTLRFGWS